MIKTLTAIGNSQGLIKPARAATVAGSANIPAPMTAFSARMATPKNPMARTRWPFCGLLSVGVVNLVP